MPEARHQEPVPRRKPLPYERIDMCNWKSAIVSRTGEVYHLDYSDSHRDIRAAYNLRDDELMLVPVQYAPAEHKDQGDITKYILTVHEVAIPAWWEEAKMRTIVARCIVTEDCRILGFGPWILTGTAKVDKACNARIVSMGDTSSVGEMRGTSRVVVMRDTSSVGEMRDTSSVGEMGDASSVGEMGGTSRVVVMLDTSSVGEMRGTSSVGEMRGTSSVGVMRGTSGAPRKAKSK